jgi:23S rRNA (pseudouridine1915-N3)-methyltransferase
MLLRLIAVGKLRTPYVAAACDDMRKRLTPYFPYEEVEVRAAHGGNADAAMLEESGRILRHVRPDDTMWLLERSGHEYSSAQLAREIDAVGRTGVTRMTFVVAGTYGADPSLRERADVLWSLSQLTYLHEWARMIVLEQLYRSAKITRNEPYHH